MQNLCDQNCINMIDIKVENFYDETFHESVTIKEEFDDTKFDIVMDDKPNDSRKITMVNDKKRSRKM